MLINERAKPTGIIVQRRVSNSSLTRLFRSVCAVGFSFPNAPVAGIHDDRLTAGGSLLVHAAAELGVRLLSVAMRKSPLVAKSRSSLVAR